MDFATAYPKADPSEVSPDDFRRCLARRPDLAPLSEPFPARFFDSGEPQVMRPFRTPLVSGDSVAEAPGREVAASRPGHLQCVEGLPVMVRRTPLRLGQ
jgi:hypothetical protein